jgi:hypothetical protein
MRRLQLRDELLRDLKKFAEAGMDYYLFSGEFEQATIKGPFILRGNGIIVPSVGNGEIYDFDALIHGILFPDESLPMQIIGITPAVLVAQQVNLPPGYVPAQGAHQLLGSVTLQHAARFFRYTSTQQDRRYVGGTIKADTYLTSISDHQFANTGFGAVGRYAIPLPMPASYLHDYTLPPSITLRVGTVGPQFGQAGGGVEVRTTADVAGVTCNSSAPISDY